VPDPVGVCVRPHSAAAGAPLRPRLPGVPAHGPALDPSPACFLPAAPAAASGAPVPRVAVQPDWGQV